MQNYLSKQVAVAALLLVTTPAFAAETLFSQGNATEGIPNGGPYIPGGTLYDNEQGNNTTSLASADSSGTFTARSADDFIIPAGGCTSGVFDVSQIRVQMVQADAAAQAFGVDLYNDDGTGNAPTAGISPFITLAQASSVVFGPFGSGTSIWEASFTPGAPLQLNADTKYWISGFGTNAAANAAGFNNFFVASNGAAATTDNGVIIAPGAGVAAWTPAEAVLGPPALAFSFAIDGTCAAAGTGLETTFDVAVPTLSTVGIAIMAALLAMVAFVVLRRH